MFNLFLSVANLSSVVAGQIPVLDDGAFIMYHRSTDNVAAAATYSSWPSLQDNGEIADGVLIIRGNKHLVVAPTNTSLFWSSKEGAASTLITSRIDAINDWSGQSRTKSIVNSAELGTDGEGYAPGYCYAYSRTNINGKGLTAGKWWLPSVGELMMIWSNFELINKGLSLINGATLLTRSWAWSSTEGSASFAWVFFLDSGPQNNWFYKYNRAGKVIPVSSFIA